MITLAGMDGVPGSRVAVLEQTAQQEIEHGDKEKDFVMAHREKLNQR
jgi:hypothetical protein